MITQPTTRTQYGIDFIAADGSLIEERAFDSKEAREAYWDKIDAEWWPEEDSYPADFPRNTDRVSGWERQVKTLPRLGIDYGPGSQVARFGGMRVPRGAYQFRG